METAPFSIARASKMVYTGRMEEFEPKDRGAQGRERVRSVLAVLLVSAVLLALLLLLRGLFSRPLAPASATPPLTHPATGEALTGLSVYFVDVGQGDCVFLRAPSGTTMLVDCGGASAYPAVDAFLAAQGVTRLELVVATHAHEDHIGGMARLIDDYEIGRFALPAAAPAEESAAYDAMLSALKRRGVEAFIPEATAVSLLDWDKACEVRVLSPFDVSYDELNDSSTVLRVSYGLTAALLTGDAGALSERMMLKALPNSYFSATVLKLGHHGSYSATGEKFLSAVSPVYAVACCGQDNAYGHPDKLLTQLLSRYGVTLLTTAERGTLHLVLDGENAVVLE